jgi:hypothetical protein
VTIPACSSTRKATSYKKVNEVKNRLYVSLCSQITMERPDEIQQGITSFILICHTPLFPLPPLK